MENTMEIKKLDDKVEITETSIYTLSEAELKREIERIGYRKEDLIRNSKRIKEEFEELKKKEKDLQDALVKLVGKPADEVEELSI
ncbi:hypothetical protein [Fenollaria massiliensis]|uniref:hypothetical protein n=1 Tax=Fenollaria massiliensis TaxID=938288 RepID=UPI00038263DD|nr:hypothetical protein [Fenollaria massiliensis]